MSQTARVYKIDQMLNNHAVVPFRTMIDALGISRATLKRDIACAVRFCSFGVPHLRGDEPDAEIAILKTTPSSPRAWG